jgi:hypothetical protein
MSKYEAGAEHIPFRFKANPSVVDILKSTKTMIQNSGCYKSYMTKHKPNNDSKTHIEPYSQRTSFAKSPNKPKLSFYNSVGDFSTLPRKELVSSMSFNKILNTTMNPINIFNTQAEIFHDHSYFDKEYLHNKIYGNTEYYLDIIRKKIEYYKININQNQTTTLHKSYNKSAYPVDVTLYSLEIKFINTTDLNTQPISFYLPYSLLPIYYFVDIETFKLVLMTILKFNDDHTNVTMREDLICDIVSIWSEYDIDCKLNSNSQNIYKFNWLTSTCIYDVYIK